MKLLMHHSKYLYQIFRLSALLCLIYVTIMPASAQADSTLVRSDPLTVEIGQNQIETVNIILENAYEVYGIEVRAKFDPAVVEVVDADPAKDGIQMTPGSFLQPDFLVRNTADNQAGTLQYVTTQTNPTPPASGTGIVLSIQLRGKTLGQQSAFTIDFVDIVDRRGVKLSVQPQNGAIVIVPPKPPTPTPLPAIVPSEPSPPATPQAAAVNPPAAGNTSTQPDNSSPRPAADDKITAQPAAMSNSEKVLIVGSLFTGLAGCVGATALLGVAALILFMKSPKKHIKRRRPL